MGANYAFKPIAEQALRSFQTIVPQRLNAALAIMSPYRHSNFAKCALALSLLIFPAVALAMGCGRWEVEGEIRVLMSRDNAYRKGRALIDPNPINSKALRLLIGSCGWPIVSLHGREAAHGAFVILQHADLELQLELAPLMRLAAERGETLPGTLPLLEDRILVRQGLHQIYGSQFKGNGEPYPIADVESLDSRRQAAGLLPFEQYRKKINESNEGQLK